MKFNITHDNKTYAVDDLVAFGMQSTQFQQLFNTLCIENLPSYQTAQLDDAVVTVFDRNRVIVTPNNMDYNENI